MPLSFSQRLYGLGFSSYEDYLFSPSWKSFKDRYRAAGNSMRCAVCDATPIQLHHHTYKTIGGESFADVTPLCDEHHDDVHSMLKNAKKPVEETAWAIAILREMLGLTQPGQTKKLSEKEQAKSRRNPKRDEKREDWLRSKKWIDVNGKPKGDY